MDTSSQQSFDRLCRTCMNEIDASSCCDNAKPQQQCQSILDKIEECGDLRIAELISNAVPQIEVQLNEEMPKKICFMCLQQLLSVYRFQQMCIKSEQQMRILVFKKRNMGLSAKPSERKTQMQTLTGEIGILPPESTPLHSSSVPHSFREIYLTVQHPAAPPAEPVQIATEQIVIKQEELQEISIDPLQNQLQEHGKRTELEDSESIKKDPTDDEPSIQYAQGDTMNSEDSASSDAFAAEFDDEGMGTSQLSCYICNKDFKELSYLKRHLKRHNTDGDADQIKMNVMRNQKFDYYPFKCDICNRNFHKPESLHKHRLGHDDKAYWHTCDFCGKGYSTDRTLARHIRNRHRDEGSQQKNTQEKPQLACDVCGKKYINEQYLVKHKIVHHSTDKPKRTLSHSCTSCDRSFSCPSALALHVRRHTQERPYLCPQCGKAFLTQSDVKKHALRHTDDKPFECPHCPRKFSCREDCTKHKRIHGIKRHICDTCGDSFAQSCQLKRHIIKHGGEKPHKCDFCGKQFGRIEHMRKHVRIHTGERPYKCQYCERAFTQSNDHIKHLRTHVGENVYRCELCPLAFRLASERRLHFASHKNDDEETRERNMNALKEEEAKMQLKIAGKDI